MRERNRVRGVTLSWSGGEEEEEEEDVADRNAESFSLERNWEDGEGFS